MKSGDAQSPRPLLELRTLIILALATLIGVTVGLSDDLTAGITIGLAVALALHSVTK